ncbi:MAG TPA: endonuclease NucS [Acidimicrobiia bacterium]|nr:endonuclease NucS [Acidimicrobiia bacterium]
MRLVIARCTVDYEGRLSAHLPEAVRLIMVKADGCVAIHADGGAYKPLNWMNAPNTLIESKREDTANPASDLHRWEVANAKGERLIIDLHEIISDHEIALGPDPGLEKDGVEAHLQELLADKPWVLEEGLVLLRREYPTDLGPVDLMCTDLNGTLVAIEVKRRGEIDGVEQLARYVERLMLDGRFGAVRAMFVAQSITPQARILARSRNIETVEVDYDGLRDAESSSLRLF